MHAQHSWESQIRYGRELVKSGSWDCQRDVMSTCRAGQSLMLWPIPPAPHWEWQCSEPVPDDCYLRGSIS